MNKLSKFAKCEFSSKVCRIKVTRIQLGGIKSVKRCGNESNGAVFRILLFNKQQGPCSYVEIVT
jgi:hypothetical protein